MTAKVPPLPLTILGDEFSIHRLHHGAKLPDGVFNRTPVFVARTDKELSIVCPTSFGVQADESSSPWRALEVAGPLDFSLVGILATLTETLAEVGVSVFAISTFDTDYLLVPGDQLDRATAALRHAGHKVD